MSLWKRFLYLWPSHRRSIEREMQEEIEALQQVAGRHELGNLTLATENARSVWGWDWLESIFADLRYALRVLRKSPAFTIVAVLSLALGIGANTAVFSVVHAVLLRPLPYPQPNQLMLVAEQPSQSDVTIPEYEFWKKNSSSFASAAGERGAGDLTLSSGDKREAIAAITVTINPPPPRPCTARKTISCIIEPLSPHSTEPARNRTIADCSTILRPNRSPSLP